MVGLSSMFQKIANPFREFGALAGFLYVIDRALSRLSPRWHLYVYELMVQPISDRPLLPRQFAQVEVREIEAGDPAIALMPVRPEVLQARHAQNAICLGAFKKDVLIGYMWFCHGAYREDEVRCTYVLDAIDESVFDFDFFLFPEHRMGTGFVALWNGANQFLHRRGIRFTFSRLTRFNVASRRAHQHLGGKIVGRALFLRMGRIEVMVATLFPYLWASCGGRVRITLRPNVLQA
jgi:hypothetical protein